GWTEAAAQAGWGWAVRPCRPQGGGGGEGAARAPSSARRKPAPSAAELERSGEMMRAHPAGPRHAEVLPPANTAGARPSTPDELDELNAAVWPRGARREADGAVRLSGVDARELAERYGTPLFV